MHFDDRLPEGVNVQARRRILQCVRWERLIWKHMANGVCGEVILSGQTLRIHRRRWLTEKRYLVQVTATWERLFPAGKKCSSQRSLLSLWKNFISRMIFTGSCINFHPVFRRLDVLFTRTWREDWRMEALRHWRRTFSRLCWRPASRPLTPVSRTPCCVWTPRLWAMSTRSRWWRTHTKCMTEAAADQWMSWGNFARESQSMVSLFSSANLFFE